MSAEPKPVELTEAIYREFGMERAEAAHIAEFVGESGWASPEEVKDREAAARREALLEVAEVLVMEPDEKLEITLQDGTVLHGRVIDASPPSDDGSVTYTVSWKAGE